MSRPVVILIPCYRCEATVVETLDSIQNQGSALSEVQRVILADDGSRDGTAAIARATWRSQVPLEILDRRLNCGEYASVNNAVEHFAESTEWFLIMHGDNVAKPGWLQNFLDRIDKATDDIGLIGSSYDTFNGTGAIHPGENEPPDRIVTVAGTRRAVADTLRIGCWWHISSCAIRVDTYLRVGGLPKVMQLKGDWDFMLRVLADGWTIEHIPRSFMLYRDNPAGSSSITFRRHMDIWETLAVIGRFHWALNRVSLLRIHTYYFWTVVRRSARTLLQFNIVRLLWTLPAMGCVVASYMNCCLDRAREMEVLPRRIGTDTKTATL
jgi:glycosyltransferase involved in cell wall biosynthesis